MLEYVIKRKCERCNEPAHAWIFDRCLGRRRTTTYLCTDCNDIWKKRESIYWNMRLAIENALDQDKYKEFKKFLTNKGQDV